MTDRPPFIFTHHPFVASFAISKGAYLTAHSDASFSHIATSTLVLDTITPSIPRILLLQRASSDSHPNKWEPPGGACDDEDESILHAAARELWEEAGLEAARFETTVGEPCFFTASKGKKVCRFSFAVQVKVDGEGSLKVRLDPKEHQRFVWATEDEVKAGKADRVNLEFTRVEVRRTVLLAFEYYRENEMQ